MKTRIIRLGFALTIAFVLLNINAFSQKEIKLKLDKSRVQWIGKKVTGAHNGTVILKSGKLIMNGANIIGGEFVMDMRTIKNVDINNEKYRKNLVRHLKSEDFFNVIEFPEAKFVVVESVNKEDGKFLVKGELTIKGITKAIEFTVNSHKNGNSLHLDGIMIINRIQFDIKYGSGSFFDNLGDRAINNNFELNFDLMF